MSEPRAGSERLDLRRLLVLVRQRLRGGRRRVRAAAVPVVTAAVAAGLAWAVAFYVLGHSQPFFAPVAAWVCLGFSADREVRKVAELAIGVSLGVALGELVAYFLRTGVFQIMFVIVVGALLARFVDRGQMLTIQAGVQGIVIVALPVAAIDGPTGRWTDALVGGSFALLVAVLTPHDARRRARQLAGASLSDLSQMLETLAKGLRDGDPERMRDALALGRSTQGSLDDWASVVRNALQSARISPAARSYLPELSRLQRASTLADRAMRNARVIARRGHAAVEQGVADDRVADALDALAVAARRLGEALGAGRNTADAAQVLALVTSELDPDDVQSGGWQLQTLVILMRSLTIDLLQAAGLSAEEANHLLDP
ncbi:FUSC family protein [Georgenia sp. H159]|uniref:FUSC family protein n=1 Tax=Georgenia sp. H159 TaxID=3076115 RepID=UPI002D79C83C|nr:FUSC family protein [Georgenia sp. H159]